jgi:4'-phosphopantetheinyl transferase
MLLAADEVHIWRAGLDLPSERVHELWPLLAPAERARAIRFQFSVHRCRFVVTRAVLRILLGCYLNLPPECVPIDYLSHGKPTLHRDEGGPPVEFNLAHSDGLGLYAFSVSRALGVDLERLRPEGVDRDLFECILSPLEAATLRALAPAVQPTAFLRCWTRKEAYLKARGDGLAVSLDSFDVTLAPGERPALLASRRDPREVMRWSFQDLSVAPDYVAALVVAGRGWQLVDRGWVSERSGEGVCTESTEPGFDYRAVGGPAGGSPATRPPRPLAVHLLDGV